MAAVKTGDKVAIHYTGKLEDGTVFDSSLEGDPLEFTAGSKDLIPGVSNAVIGMKPGESKTVEVPEAEGYGPHLPGYDQRIGLDELPEGLNVGDSLRAQAEGRTVIFWVTEMDDTSAVLDINHPLAGKKLIFDIELVSLEIA
jgi:peptidylprolyl isomerase